MTSSVTSTAFRQWPISLYSSDLRLGVTRARTVLPSGGATATQRLPDSYLSLITKPNHARSVPVKAQTSIRIPNEGVDAEHAKIRVLPIHARSVPLPPIL